jgi:transposase
LTSIPGVGEVTANVLVVETPELGCLEHAQAASLVGLAPVPRDSGQTHGKRSIRGGRPRARQALYMPALAALSRRSCSCSDVVANRLATIGIVAMVIGRAAAEYETNFRFKILDRL